MDIPGAITRRILEINEGIENVSMRVCVLQGQLDREKEVLAAINAEKQELLKAMEALEKV